MITPNPDNSGLPTSAPGRKLPPDFRISLALLLGVVLLRLPAILWPHELNVDESGILSQAMKYLVDPIPWRSVDGTSSGPVSPYLLSGFLRLGFRPGYELLHFVAAILAGLQVVLAHRTLLRLAPGKPVLFGLIPLFLALGFTRESEFLFFASELLPSLFLASGFHLFVMWLDPVPGRSTAAATRLLFLAGLALGAAPWSKLQALPIAGALGLGILVTALKRQAWFATPASPVRDCAAFARGALLPAILILPIVAAGGALREFWASYILGNLSYAGPFQVTDMLFRLERCLECRQLWAFLATLVAAAALGLVLLVKRRVPSAPRESLLIGSVALFIVPALFAVSRPAGPYLHYLILLFYPLTLLGPLPLLRSLPSDWPSPRIRTGASVLVAVVLTGLAGSRLLDLRGRTAPPPDRNEILAAEILKLQKDHPVQGLTIWGWAPGVHVLTGIPPATRDAISHFVISSGSMQGYFRKRYVDDLRRARPDVFIDAIASGAFLWKWSVNDGYESEESLKRFVDEEYELWRSVPLAARGKPARIFIRRGTPTPR